MPSTELEIHPTWAIHPDGADGAIFRTPDAVSDADADGFLTLMKDLNV